MGIFNNIVENVLTEISANDAYEKFYSSIPRKSFDEIISAYGGKFDGFIKLLLQGLIDGDFKDNSKILYCISAYKKLDNKYRIHISNKIKNKEYADAIELFYDIKNAESGQINIISYKSLYENGLVVLFENDEWKITCTTNYAASHHFYAKSSWCTASDRFGRYDGFIMFSEYITNTTTENESMDSKIKATACLMQFINKQKLSESIQAQLNSKGVMCACDFKDNEIGTYEFMDFLESNSEEVCDFFKDTLYSNKKILDLIELTQKQREIELPYELGRKEYVKRKREKEEARRRKKAEELKIEAEEKRKEHYEYVKSLFEECCSKKAYMNPNFINGLQYVDSVDIEELSDNLEDAEFRGGVDDELQKRFDDYLSTLKKNYFLMKSDFKRINYTNKAIVKLEMVEGIYYTVNTFNEPKLSCEVFSEGFFDGNDSGSILLLVEINESFEVISVIKELSISFDKYSQIAHIDTLCNAFKSKDSFFDNFYVKSIWLDRKKLFEIHNILNGKSIKFDDYLDVPYHLFKCDNNNIVAIGTNDTPKLYEINLSDMAYIAYDISSTFGFGKIWIGMLKNTNILYYTTNIKFNEFNDINKVYLKVDGKDLAFEKCDFIGYLTVSCILNGKFYVYMLPKVENPVCIAKTIILNNDYLIQYIPDGKDFEVVYYLKANNTYMIKKDKSGIETDMYGNPIENTLKESFKKMKKLYRKIN